MSLPRKRPFYQDYFSIYIEREKYLRNFWGIPQTPNRLGALFFRCIYLCYKM